MFKQVRSNKVLLAELFPVAMIVLIPFSVHAGVISSLINLVQEDVVTYSNATPSTHAGDISLLRSGTNADPQAALGGGDIIVEEGALMPGGPFGKDEYAQSNVANGEISVYVVREGDSLSQIAEMFDVTTNTIFWANDLRSTTAISPGDSLVILPIVGVRHLVKKGDTIDTIAKKYEGDTEEILAYNQLTSADQVNVGETLVIPGGNMHKAVPKRIAAKTSGSPTRTSGSVSSGGAYIHPVPGSVRTQGLHGYNAVDLAAPMGTPILASAAGEVIVSKASGWNGGYGSYIVIRHPKGSQTLYAHNSSNIVGVGEFVAQGQVIGYVGSTGRSTGAHVHFEVRGAANPF